MASIHVQMRMKAILCIIAMVASLFSAAPAVFAATTITNGNFETGNLTGWTVLSGNLPTQPTNSTRVNFNKEGSYFIGTCEIGGGAFDDAGTGVIKSDAFTVGSPFITFLIGGGGNISNVYVALVRNSDGVELLKSTGSSSEAMVKEYWDVRAYNGVQCYIKIVDNSSGGWGHINADNFQGVDALSMGDTVSMLEAQIGYHPEDVKKVYLRSAMASPPVNPTGKTFNIVSKSDGSTAYTGTVSYWGSKWGSYWWTLDFSGLKTAGSYYAQVNDAGGNLVSSVFQVGNAVFTDNGLVTVALDQLDARILPGVPGWRDCGSEIREVSSHAITVHGLVDIYENIFGKLSPANQTRLKDAVMRGADYIVYSQETSPDPLLNGRFNHDKAHKTEYGTSDYYNWHDTAYAITALVKAYNMIKNYDAGKANTYLNAAVLAYNNATYRPYQLASDFAGPDGGQTAYVNSLARLYYNKGSSWTLPTTLRTKEKLTFTWACTLLYQATGNTAYKNKAIEFADSAAERQFTDYNHPVDGAFGNFYEFEGDDTAFLTEWGQSHRWHMGNVEPTNLKGFIDLLNLFPDDPKAAKWYNVIKTYGDNYVKNTAALSPFKIYPVAAYKDTTYGGVKFFMNILHGANALYGQIAKNQMEIGEFLNDRSYQELANQNVEFMAGLNPGIPTASAEKAWTAMTFLKGIGNRSFPGYGSIAAPPAGSGINGFVFGNQFGEHPISYAPDAPKGILDANGGFQFNEDYLPHSHGYVSGVSKLEGNFTLNIATKSNGTAVNAAVAVNLPETYSFSTGAAGSLAITTLPLQRSGTVSVTYGGKTITKSLQTLASSKYTWNVDFATYVDVSVSVPATVGSGGGTGTLSVTNRGTGNTAANVTLSASGVSLGTSSMSIPVNAGATVSQDFTIAAGSKVMPYLVYAYVTSGNNTTTAIGTGKCSGGGGTSTFVTNLSGWTALNGTWSDIPGGKQGIGGGDAFLLSTDTGTDFTYEGDIRLSTNNPSAGSLIFRSNSNATQGYVVNVSTENGGQVKLFKLPYAQLGSTYGVPGGVAVNTVYHLKVAASGSNIKVYFNNGTSPVIDVNDSTYSGGRFGLLAWQGTSVFQNVNRGTGTAGFNSNLSGWTAVNGGWSDVPGGKQGIGGGDAFLLASDTGTDVTYSGDIKVTTDNPSAGALVFRSNSNASQCYIVNLSTENGGTVKLFKLPYQVVGTPYSTPISVNTVYNLKVVASGANIKVYFNNSSTPCIDAVDSSYTSGQFGIQAWQGTALFQNVNK